MKGYRWVVPSKIPKGFKLKTFTLEKGATPIETYLSLTYTKGKGDFILQMASDGIGDVILDAEDDPNAPIKGFWADTKLFGRVRVDTLRTPKTNQFGLNWQELKGTPKFLSAVGSWVDEKSIKTFLSGLHYLK